ncbi:MAG: SpoIID/LytB domain-containing protein, partial [Candidatus Sumerlaeota bacterium]
MKRFKRAKISAAPQPQLKMVLAALILLVLASTSAQDITKDTKNLQQRQYFIRVGLVADANAMRVVPHTNFVLHDREGRVLHEGFADTPIRFNWKNPKTQKSVYYHCIADYPADQEEQAEAFFKKAEKVYQLPVHKMRDPRVDRAPLPDGSMPSPADWMVVVGPFDTYQIARNKSNAVGKHFKSFIFRTLDKPESSTIVEARDASGKILASAKGYLGVRSPDHGALMRASWVHSTSTDWHKKESWIKMRAYHGLIEVWGNKRGRLTLVNRVFLEDYLYGVVPPEIGNGVAFEMKKVQAVISRSVAIAKLRQNLHNTWHFDVCDEQHCQAYHGALAETPESNAAVDATWGQVCLYEDEVINAVFSLCCGGATGDSTHAWGGKKIPYLQDRVDAIDYAKAPDFGIYENAEKWVAGRPDVLCNPDQGGLPAYGSRYFRWTRSYSEKELRKTMSQTYLNIDKITN